MLFRSAQAAAEAEAEAAHTEAETVIAEVLAKDEPEEPEAADTEPAAPDHAGDDS